MIKDLEITGTYEPDSNLQTQLEKLPDMGGISILETQQYELVSDASAIEIVTKGIFAGDTVIRTDAETPFGVISTYEGDLRLAAAMILVDSLDFGAPTVAYKVRAGSGHQESNGPVLTAEWHHDALVSKVSENEAVGQPDCVDSEGVSLQVLEKQAKYWFASH